MLAFNEARRVPKFGSPGTRKLSKLLMSNISRFTKIVCVQMFQGVFSIFVCPGAPKVFLSPKIKIIGFGAQGHVQESRNHRNEGLGVLP